MADNGQVVRPADRTARPRALRLRVAFDKVSVTYAGEGQSGGVVAVAGVSFEVLEGEFVSLIGPSGCGKSTLLRLAADLVAPSSGRVEIDGETPRAARMKREIGFVFQDSALMPWRTVLDNVLLPLELQGVARADRIARAHTLLTMVGLSGFEQVYPRHLSGGMRQRAAIARAMSTSPKLLLMDEPFGALDQITRDRMNLELLDLFQRSRMTVLFVTHSIREAVLLSDRVLVMSPRPGRLRRALDVDLPRPRRLAVREDPRFAVLAGEGLAELEGGFEPDGG